MPSQRQQGRQSRKENQAGELAGRSRGDWVPHAALQGQIFHQPPSGMHGKGVWVGWGGGGGRWKAEKTTGLATVEVCFP